MGKKSKYESNIVPNLDRIAAWARDGITEKKMAETLHVAYTTWKDYKTRYPSFSSLLARNKEYVDNVEMVNAYKKRAEGYTTTEKRLVYAFVADPNTGEVKRQLVQEIIQEKHVPGDPRAMENWLRLRQREVWGEAIQTDEENRGGIAFLSERKKLEEPKDE